MAWRIVVDRDLCQGHAACELEAPDIFRVPKGGTVDVIKENPSDDQVARVREAVRYCPTSALSLVEESHSHPPGHITDKRGTE
jgi:ferredoxin